MFRYAWASRGFSISSPNIVSAIHTVAGMFDTCILSAGILHDSKIKILIDHCLSCLVVR